MTTVYQWIQSNIGNYGGDSTRIDVGGHSAGGYTSAVLSYVKDLQIKSFFGNAPVLSFDAVPGDGQSIVPNNASDVDSNDPPAFTVHGGSDTAAPLSAGTTLKNNLAADGVEGHAYELPSVAHSQVKTELFTNQAYEYILEELADFLERANGL